MICLAVTLGVLGFAAMRRAHHRYHGCGYGFGWHGPYGYGCHGHHGGGCHHGFPGRPGRRAVHALLSRIDASPAQERAIIAEVDKLKDRLGGAKASLGEARGDLAAAVRGPALDDAALGAMLGRVDTASGEARAAVIEALRGIHGTLDDKQRAQLADLLDHGPGWWRTGPYR